MLGLGLGLGRNLLLGGGSDGNLVPGIDFTTWYNVPLSPMASMTTDTFTNSGTGYIQLDIGAVAGEVYTITISQTRGAGTCLIYLAAEQGVTQADDVWALEGGEETITLVADGPWLTFRASVGDTTTTVTELSVKKAEELPALIHRLYGGGEAGAFYIPQPVVLGEQVLFQDAAGTIPVTADGDPVGLMQDASGNSNNYSQASSGARPTQLGGSKLSFDGVDDFMKVDFPVRNIMSEEFLLSVAVEMPSFDTGGPFAVSCSNYGVTNWMGIRVSSGNYVMRASDSNGDARDIVGPPESDGFHVFSITHEGDGFLRFYVDGVYQGSSEPSGMAVAGFFLGCLGRNTNSLFGDASIAGLALSFSGASLRGDVERYLAEIAGASLP